MLSIEFYSKIMATIGEILNSKIGKGGKSKAYVASELGVSEKTIENYMNGKRFPKPQALVKLSKLLEFNLNELSEQNVPYGKNGQESPVIKPGDYKDKYIVLLEKMLSDSNSEQVAKLVKQNQALLMTLQTGLARLISKAEKKEVREVAHELRKETIANLESVGIL